MQNSALRATGKISPPVKIRQGSLFCLHENSLHILGGLPLYF
jgi:hypothetical protein